MPKSIAASDLASLLRPGMHVYAPGLSGEPTILVDGLKAGAECCAGVSFIGVWIPGMNRVDYAGLHPQARATAFFATPETRESRSAGKVDHLPVSYFAAYGHLRDRAPVDLALVQVSPPGADGRCSLGVANDFTPAVLDKSAIIVAHVNARMPRTTGAATLHLDDLDYVVEAECDLLGDDTALAPPWDVIGRYVADLIEDGDAVEVGVGRVQSVYDALSGKRDITVHVGLIGDAVMRAARTGVIAERPDAITTGVAWGTRDLHEFAASDPRVRFAPVGWTHDITTLASVERFVAVNSVIEVDLLGQANAEMIGGRQVGAAGGLTDFMRGARASPGGRAIVALESTVKGGSVSRIVPALAADTSVSVARGDMEIVVTENGVADLRGKSVDARAEALIAIAAPAFRDELAEAWAERRRRM